MLEHDIGTVNTFVDGVPTAQHHLVAGLYPNKMLTLSENGGVPSIAQQWNAGVTWLYFAPWYDYGNDHTENYAHQHADIAWWNASWACEDVLGLDELPDNLYK